MNIKQMLDLVPKKGDIWYFVIDYAPRRLSVMAFSKLKIVQSTFVNGFLCIISSSHSIEHHCHFYLEQGFHAMNRFKTESSIPMYIDIDDNKVDCDFQLNEHGRSHIFCNQKDIYKKLLCVPFLSKKQYPNNIPLGKEVISHYQSWLKSLEKETES